MHRLGILCALALGTASAASAAQGLSATYVDYQTDRTITRVDPTVDFSWGSAAPDPSLGADYFQATWLGFVTAKYTETYTFTVRSDDGVRLWVNDQLVAGFIGDRGEADTTGTIALVAGVKTPVRIEYFERTGSAAMKFYWQSAHEPKAIVPAAQLTTADPLRINLAATATSAVSPVCLEGHVLPGAGATITASGLSTAPARTVLSRVSFFANVPLDAAAVRTISVASGGTTRTSAVTWQPTDLSGKNPDTTRIGIRAGDSLLLTGSKAGKLVVTRGYSSTTVPITAGQRVAQAFTTADVYTVTAQDAAGAAYGAITVIAATLDVPTDLRTLDIDCAVGTTRTLPVPVIPSSEPNQVVFATDGFAVDVTTTAGTGTAKNLNVTPAQRGKLPIYARLRPNGPILGVATVGAFLFDTTASKSAQVISTDADGTRHAKAKMAIFPYTPGMKIFVSMFAHTATFLGGATSFSIRTSDSTTNLGEPGFKQIVDPTTGERYGILEYTIILPPGETQYCHNVTAVQVY